MSRGWRAPRPVCPGDTIGVCAPAGPVDPDGLESGVAELRRLGFEVSLAPGVRERLGFVAGAADTRAAELMDLLEAEHVGAVICARGGAGAIQVLPHLDPARLPSMPKAVVGFSDITLLHLWLQRCGWGVLHGPMVARDLAAGSYDEELLLATLAGDRAFEHGSESGLRVLRGGRGRGVLLGGCLSLLAAAVGTPWGLVASEPVVLFIEDVNEPAYRVDRLLRQLLLSGTMNRVVGVVLGQMHRCAQDVGLPGIEQVVVDALGGMRVPIALGLRSGHVVGPNLTLPLGCPATLVCEGDVATLTIEETEEPA